MTVQASATAVRPTAAATLSIYVRDAHLVYPGGKEAVRGVSFQVRKGESFGFLGPNGAGKTTTIKMMATLLRPTRGKILVNGYDVVEDPVGVRSTIGYTAQDTAVDPELTARESIRFACESYRVPRAQRARRVAELLKLVGLEEVARKTAMGFSGGMKKRLDIATSLVHRPPLLFLDEPTTGLDPKARLQLWDYFRELKRSGTTLFLTTQYLEEADQLCDRIALIDHGRVMAVGTPDALKAQVGGDALEIRVAGGPVASERAKDAITRSKLLAGRDEKVGIAGVNVVVTTSRARRIGTDLLFALRKEKLEVEHFNVRSPTLDDVFLTFTGQTIEEATTRAAEEAKRAADKQRGERA